MPPSDHILLFDGVCNLCNGLVKFIIRHDRQGKIKFAPLQSISGQSLMSGFFPDNKIVDSVIFIRKDKLLVKSSAVLNIFRELGRGWRFFYCLIIIPFPVRDFFYDIIARTRYRIFGRMDTCMVPDPEIASRFL
jgi:predicted DCC family thiol-disulfide oxidoreductase YuxK